MWLSRRQRSLRRATRAGRQRGRRPTGAPDARSPSGVGAAGSGPGPRPGRGRGPAVRPGPPGAVSVAVVLAPLAGAGTTVSGGSGRSGRAAGPAIARSALAVEQAGDRAVAE